MHKAAVYIFLIFSFTRLQAQRPNYLYNEITTKEGLAQVTVNFVQQDAKGYIWFGGNNVVQRYDGHRFQNFYIGKNSKIPGSNLQGMQYDSVKNRLWLLTGNNELGYLDADKLTYHAVKIVTPPGFENTWFALQVNKEGGVILIYVDKGITTFNEQANEVAAKYNTFTLPAGWEPRHVWQDEWMHCWVGTKNGLLKYNSKKKLLSYRGHNEENDLVIHQFAKRAQPCVVYAFRNIVWVFFDTGNGQEVYSYDSDNGELKEWQPVIRKALQGKYHAIHGVLRFKDGSTWMMGDELFAQVNYQQHSLSLIKAEAAGTNSIWYDDIYNMYQDREKSNWVCTNKGLFRFNPSAHVFNTISNTLLNDAKNYNHSVTGFVETNGGEILVSTWGAGIFSYNSTFSPVPSKYIKRAKPADAGMAWCLLQTKSGDIWQGHQDGKLGIYNAASGKTNWLYPEPANRRTIRQLAEDKNGNVWLGTHGGQLVKWDHSSNTFKLALQFKRVISRLYTDTKNNLWVCTDNDGVHCINTSDGKILRSYTENDVPGKRLLTNGASDIIQYDDTTMVISSNGLSILNTKTETFRYLDEGTPIFSMALDRKKNLWFTFNTGIACRIFQNDELIYTFDQRDGIGNTEFHTGAAVLLRNGYIAFGTSHDILFFDPAVPVNFTLGKPSVHVSGIILGDKRLSVDSVLQLKTMELSYKQNSLSFYFTNNQFQTLQNIHYMVEGLDNDWKKLPAGSQLNLTYLPPGKYVIKATCFNEELKPGIITSISITVAPPFYKTWWFYSFIALAIGGLLFWFDRERTKRKEAMQQMRSNIAGNLHQDVNTALNNINILSEIALMKSANEPDKAKEFVQQIQSKSHNMMIAMDDMLWAISPDNDSMEKTVERMQEYIDALNSRHEAHIEMLVETKVKSLNIDMQLRHEAFLLFKESISSLVKAGARQCKIHLRLDKTDLLLYAMECKNEDCDMQQLNNLLHRQDIAKRLEAIRAKMDVQVHKSISVLRCRIQL
jgi:ligand-binding sensor domain-containing protein